MIEFIIPTWERPNNLKVILSSLQVQTNPNWSAHVIIDGLTNDYRKVKDLYQDDERIRFSHIEGPNNDWGHTARNYGLDNCKEEWVVMTGDDNYYVPTFVDNFLDTGHKLCEFVFCNLVHEFKRDDYQPVPSKIQYGYIDIGNFMTRMSVVKELRLNTKSYNADWEFIEEYMKRIEHTPIKIDKILYVHN